MKNALLILLIALSASCTAQVDQVLSDLRAKTTSEYGKVDDPDVWHLMGKDAVIAYRTNALGLRDGILYWVDFLVQMKDRYQHTGRTSQDVFYPSYVNGINDHENLELAVRTGNARVVVYDRFLVNGSAVHLVLSIQQGAYLVMLINQ